MTKNERAYSRAKRKDLEEYGGMNRTPYRLMTKAYNMKSRAEKETDIEVKGYYYKRAGWWLGKYIEEMEYEQ